MKHFLKRWLVWLLALLAIGAGLWYWHDSGRLKIQIVGRATCEMEPIATDSGLLCFPKWHAPEADVPSSVELFGWDGKMRWRISIPEDDGAAFFRWHPGWQYYSTGGRADHSPDGRIYAVSIFEPAGARIMIWRDGQLCADHHLKVRPGALFDGKSGVDLNVLDDGRVFAFNKWEFAGYKTIFLDNRILYAGKRKSKLPCPARYIVSESHNKLQVIDKYSGSGWTLPPEATPEGNIRTVVSSNGRFVFYCSDSKYDNPMISRVREFIAHIPGLGQVDDQRVSVHVS